jgi:hypothetical protein
MQLWGAASFRTAKSQNTHICDFCEMKVCKTVRFFARNEGEVLGETAKDRKADPSPTTPKLKNVWGPVLSG